MSHRCVQRLERDLGVRLVRCGYCNFPDVWLLTAAIRGGMKLLTFDAGVEQLLANAQERGRHVTVLKG